MRSKQNFIVVLDNGWVNLTYFVAGAENSTQAGKLAVSRWQRSIKDNLSPESLVRAREKYLEPAVLSSKVYEDGNVVPVDTNSTIFSHPKYKP